LWLVEKWVRLCAVALCAGGAKVVCTDRSDAVYA